MIKKDLIIIPGAYHLTSELIIKKTIKKIYPNSKVNIHYGKSYKKLIKLLSKNYDKIHFVRYNRRFFRLFDKDNITKVKQIIKKANKNYDVLAFSFGGYLIQQALRKTKKYPKKIVLVCSFNPEKSYKFPKKTKVINIQSKQDIFLKEVTHLLSRKEGDLILSNAKNILLENLKHTQLETNTKIKSGRYKGFSTFRLIKKFLD